MPQIYDATGPAKPRRDKPSPQMADKLAAAEGVGLGTLPTSIVYAGALAANDDKEAARWAALIARQLDIEPADPRKPPPPKVTDPFTGKGISVGRINQLFAQGDAIATILQTYASAPLARRRPPPATPEQVAAYASITRLLPDLDAATALAWSLDTAKKAVDPARVRANLSVISGWNESTGTISDEETLLYATWWAQNMSEPITRSDVVALTTPEIAEAIAGGKGSWGKLSQAAGLIVAREKLLTEGASYLPTAQKILSTAEVPTWMDRAIGSAVSRANDDWWKLTQRIAIEAATLPVGLIKLVEAAAPGGMDYGEAIRTVQQERSFFIQRLNEGGSIGEVYVENGDLPPWAGLALDFMVGVAFDPTVVGGKLAMGSRAGYLAPELLEGGTVRRALTPTPIRNYWAEHIQLPNFGGQAIRFSRGKESRALFDAAYVSQEAMDDVIRVLPTHVEARSALEYQFAAIARDRLLTRFPKPTERAWQEWQTAMRAHFAIPVPANSLGAEVVALRQGQIAGATEDVIRVSQTGEGLVISDDIVRRGGDALLQEATPLALRYEVPHRILPITSTGRRTLRAMERTRLGQTDLFADIRSPFNVNPGQVMRVHHDPELFIARKAHRWRVFGEDEVKVFHSRAINATLPGRAMERELAALLEEMDRTAIRRILNRWGTPDVGISKIVDEVTAAHRRVNEQTVFGIGGRKPGSVTVVDRPIMETELVNEIISMDPVQVRAMLHRYHGTLTDLITAAEKVPGMGKLNLTTLASKAFNTTQAAHDWARLGIRAWKFSVVPRPAYIPRVILLDEGLRFASTTGSLLEHFAAFELKKGLRGLLGKGLDAIFTEKIPVGDGFITLTRAGSHGYEPLANSAFRAEEALGDVIRRTDMHDRALRTLGHYGIVRPKDPQHMAVWVRTLNLQLGQSVPGRLALLSVSEGASLDETIATLVKWGRGRGADMLERIGRTDVDGWAQNLAHVAHGYTVNSPEIARLALVRGIADDVLDAAVPLGKRPTVHGPLVESLTDATMGGRGILQRSMERVYTMFVRAPENVLNRQPYYRVWKRRAERAQLRILEANGGIATPEVRAAIDASSRDFALQQLDKIMFDFTQNTRFGELAATVYPFFQPTLEAYQVWGHILVHRNPAIIGYVNQAWRTAKEAGFVEQDENGSWVVPWGWWKRIASHLPWVGDALPPGLGLSASATSFNMFLSSSIEVGGVPVPVPSPSPWAGFILRQMFENTENPYLHQYLFQYGPETRLAPAWMENAARSLFPERFQDQRRDAIAMDYLRLYQFNGTNVDENGDPIPLDELQQRAREDADAALGLLAVTGLFAPTAGRITFPPEFEARQAELDQLRDTYGFEAGTDAFLDKYPDLTLMTVGKTIETKALSDIPGYEGITPPRTPTTEEVQRLFRQPGFERFAKRFPMWTALLVLSRDEQWDDSSLAAFSEAVHDDQVRYKSLDAFLTEGEAAPFWEAVDHMYAWYNPLADAYENRGLEDDNAKVEELNRRKGEALYELYLKYPAYAAKQGIRPVTDAEGNLGDPPIASWDGDAGTPPSAILLKDARAIVNLPGFETFPAVLGLKAYLGIVDEFTKRLSAAGVANIGDTTAQRLGITAEWDEAQAAVIEQFPDVEPFIGAFFDNILKGVPNKADQAIVRMETRNPAKYEQFTIVDTELERLQDATQTGSERERQDAYTALRDYVNTLYETKKEWAVKLWFNKQSGYDRLTDMEFLRTRPLAFYSRFDWEQSGVKLTDDAAEWLRYIDVMRGQIFAAEEQLILQGVDLPTGQVIDTVIDAYVAERLGQDKSFDQAVGAMNTWGWSLWNSDLVERPGKAGWAWQNLRDTVLSVNEQVLTAGLTGINYGTVEERQAYAIIREYVRAQIEEYKATSDVFAADVADIEKTLDGELWEWLIPETYYPLGVVAED